MKRSLRPGREAAGSRVLTDGLPPLSPQVKWLQQQQVRRRVKRQARSDPQALYFNDPIWSNMWYMVSGTRPLCARRLQWHVSGRGALLSKAKFSPRNPRHARLECKTSAFTPGGGTSLLVSFKNCTKVFRGISLSRGAV